MAVLVYRRPDDQLAFIEFDATISEGHSAGVLITDEAVEEGANISDHVRVNPDLLTLDVSVTNTPIRFPPAGSFAIQSSEGAVLKLAEQRRAFANRQNNQAEIDTMDVGIIPAKFRDGDPSIQRGRNGEVIFGTGVRTPDIAPQITPSAIIEPDTELKSVEVLQFQEDFDRVFDIYEELIRLMNQGQVFNVLTSLRDYESMAIHSVDTSRTAGTAHSADIIVVMKTIRIVTSETVQLPDPVEPRGQNRNNGGGQSTDEATPEEEENVSLWYRLAGL